jgi:uncharacterized protein YjiS (DUF1127 family)
MVTSLVAGHSLTATEFNEREGTMTTAGVQTIETFTQVSSPDFSRANPGTRFGAHHGLGPERIAQSAHHLATKLSSTISLWCARSRQRRALGDLIEPNCHFLDDIGVTLDQASREAAKWFWQK